MPQKVEIYSMQLGKFSSISFTFERIKQSDFCFKRFHQFLYDRWNFCNNLDSNRRTIFISYDTGFEDRYDVVHIQNWLSGISNTVIIYPLASYAFQEEIRRYYRPER
jgi:hypothetical protein